MNLHLTARARTLEAYIEEQVNLRRVTNLELAW
jgi:hypothetical protein